MPFELCLSNLSHQYGQLTVLEDISCTVRQGEIVAIVGPSGCGKSTLLNVIGGLVQPSRGTVDIIGDLPGASFNPFTFVFQDFALLPWRTVKANVELSLEHHALSRREREQRVSEVLARMGLSEFEAALPKQLSGGMRQRVGIARALVVDPAMLLMDEPLSALDAQTRDLLMDDFCNIWERDQTTAAYVTHNLNEALRLADRIMVLRRRPGRIRGFIDVPIPRAERRLASAAVELRRLHDELWDDMREEARLADRETANA